MTLRQRLAEWVGVRPPEVRVVLLSFAGAFVVMAFLVLSRALREAAYLARFDADTLPYAIGGVVALGLPAAALFGRMAEGRHPRSAMRGLALLLSVAVAATWPFLPDSPVAVVVFYLLTAVGTVLLTSGFWLVVSELLVVREAKRLFGLISAGGTLGVMVTGLGVGAAVQRWPPDLLVPALVLLLLASAAINEVLPPPRRSADAPTGPGRWLDGLRAVRGNRHVLTLTMVVLLVAALGTVVDFLFQEAAQDALGDERALAGFFGAFYGWTGGLALLVQLFLTTPVLSRGGVARSVGVLPALLLGVAGLLFFLPGLATATLARGADSTIKKSLFRSVVEFLWVPVRGDVRRRTKTVVDTTAENAGDGLGALIVFLLVTLGGLPPRALAFVVAGLCLLLFALASRMGEAYLATLRARLAEGASGETLAMDRPMAGPDPQTLSRVDLTRLLSRLDAPGAVNPPSAPRPAPDAPSSRDDVWTMLPRLGDAELRAKLQASDFGAEDVSALARLLARDGVRELVAGRLADMGEAAAPALGSILRDPASDFVVRRRVAQVLGYVPGREACEALVHALRDGRFEVRYRAARALARRRKGGQALSPGCEDAVWEAIREELARGRAVWELARLLDATEHDELAGGRAAERGELSLEHVFRMLTLVFEADAMVAAWRGVSGGHTELRSLALEYLEQVLPPDVRQRLWPFIGDLSVEQSRRAIRPLPAVIDDLLTTGATLFAGPDRQRLERYLDPAADAEPDADA